MEITPTQPKPRVRRGSGRITLADVARVAGVAPMTASRALNAPDTVNAEMVERVRRAVLDTGYVPNLLAGALASARSLLVAVIVPSIASTLYLEFLQALRSALASKNYQVILGESDYAHQDEPALLNALIARRPEAIVNVGTIRSPEGRLQLTAAQIPVIETWDMTSEPIDMLVGFSQVGVGRAAADFLITEGRRHPAIISASDERAAMRAEGFLSEINERTATDAPAVYIPAPSTLGAGRRAFVKLLAENPLTDSVFCSSDIIALGVLIEAKSRGLHIPADIAVIGFGDHNFAADTDPPLTTIRADGKIIGREAARLILERAAQIPCLEPIVDVGFSIVRRQSA